MKALLHSDNFFSSNIYEKVDEIVHSFIHHCGNDHW